MWIGVEGGKNNGKRQSKQDMFTFRPDTNANPIPQGSSASIIFSHDLIVNKFFRPSLSAGFSNLKPTSTKGTPGMNFTGNLISEEVKIDEVRSAGNTFSHDALSFSPSEPAATITVHPDVATPNADPVKISYTSKEYSMDWGKLKINLGPGIPIESMTPGDYTSKGTVKPTFKWNAYGKWEGGSLTTHNNLLNLNFTSDKLWTVTYRGSGVDNWFTGETTSVPVDFTNKSVPAPAIKMEMKALDYFLATNLLFPGKQVFKAHPVADGDTTKGLAVPRDLILTGEVKTV
ncbi:hypothetical protein BDV38DRAFT_287432 [Aspergillus pseudotamarii]|uniref:Uncharacterized protein n=1 Tax=Aspergillus pseudotamarii TaxID=132259 RepID=A0A5N6SDN6_ASPPS|nr:uncharacterized protein BDV38DRAFT_287432 [Aspergillus pseudotamarii]KAE8132836.1 hypothetical protein BDV38DRAFT_287432 [Aspergillus pseudotamarii]